MDWTRSIDIYCERTDPAFWSEPVNALTNLAFIAAALWGAWTLHRRRHGAEAGPDTPAASPTGTPTDAGAVALIVLAALIGIGSFLFHTFATVWSGLADVIPIWLFVALYTILVVARLSRRHPLVVALPVLLAFAALVLATRWLLLLAGLAGAPQSPDPLNGSAQYAPALVALYGFAALLMTRRHPLGRWLAAAAAVFTLSLVFRTLDRSLCPALPLGVHFLWHLLNGAMIALLLQGFLRNTTLFRP